MREVLDGAEEEAGKIIKRRENIVPNDDEASRAPAKMVRLEFHADEVAGRRSSSRNERDTGYANSAVGGGGGEAGAAVAATAEEGGDDSDDCAWVETDDDDDDSEDGAGAEDDGEEEEGEIEMPGKTRCISSSFELSPDDRGEVERQVGGEIRSLMERQIRLYDEAASDERKGATIRLRFEIDIKTAVVVVEGRRSRRQSRQRKFRPGWRPIEGGGGERSGRCQRVPQRNQQQTATATSKMLGLEEGQRFQSEGGAASLHLIQPASASAATPLSKQRSCVPSNEPDCCKVELSEAPSGHNTAPPTTAEAPSAPAAVDRVIRAAAVAAAPGRKGGGRDSGDGFTFICLSCPETFPISDLDAVTDHIATGFYKADGRCSAALDLLAQRVKLTVNDAGRTVSANTLLSCRDCGRAEFDVTKRGQDVIGDIHRHLTAECGGGGSASAAKRKKRLGGNFCPFCDRRISASAGADMSAHLADRRFRRAHYERLRAMLTCGCRNLLLAAAAANGGDLRCKLCSKPNRRPHPALPEWLSRSACDKCLRSTVAKIERGGGGGRAKGRVVVVLCAFCKQGKFGYEGGGKGCSSVCVDCFDLLDSFRRQLPAAPMMSNDGGGAAAECRNYVYGILNELVRKERNELES